MTHSAKGKHLTTSGIVRTGHGYLGTVCVNTAVASSKVTIYDGTDNTGTVIAVLDTTAVRYQDFDGFPVTNGIYVEYTTGVGMDITVTAD